MANRSGPDIRVLAPLLILLLFRASAAAPFSAEKAYREARAAADRGDFAAASEMAGAAIARAGAAETEWSWALRILELEMLAATGSPKEARGGLERALPAKYRTSEAAVRRLIALGHIPGKEKSPQLFEEARKLAAAHQPHLLFGAHLALVHVAKSAAAKEAHLDAAMRIAQANGNRLQRALVIAATAKSHSDQQRYAEAVEPGHRALKALTGMRAHGRAASVAGNLGWTYLELGEFETAHELFVAAEAAAARVKNERGRIIWINHLGNVAFERRAYADAARWYGAALQRARTTKDGNTAAILTNLARTALETGRYADAKRFAAEALAVTNASVETNASVDQKLRTRIVEARIAMMTGEHERAESVLRDVASKAENAAARWWAEGYLAQLYARTGRNELAERAFRRAIETVRDARSSIPDPELRLSFFNVSADIFRSYVDFLVQNERVEDALAATELIRAQSLEEQLKVPPVTRRLDARAIAKQQNATILSYWLGSQRSHLWIVTRAAVTYSALPREQTIVDELTAYRTDLMSPRGQLKNRHFRERGARLWSMLVAPAAAKMAKDAHVIVIADGALHTLNFETLVAPKPAPHYWIEDAIISSASSLQLLARLDAPKKTAASMLLVGDALEVDPALPRLQYAAEEIQQVARHFGSRVVLEGANATPAAYRNAAPGRFEFVHFVAHAVSTRRRPLDSAVILGRDSSNNYKLVARDIATQPLHARLVTISSCHGAGERTFAGEGLVGLAWAFLFAGSDEVIAALWEANDTATPKLMDRMYAGIRAGRDPAVALRDAKLTLVRTGKTHDQPRYWAPFVLYSGG
jgi:CHAT domain-containing protein